MDSSFLRLFSDEVKLVQTSKDGPHAILGTSTALANNASKSFNGGTLKTTAAASRFTLSQFFSSLEPFISSQSTNFGKPGSKPLCTRDIRESIRLTAHARMRIVTQYRREFELDELFETTSAKSWYEANNLMYVATATAGCRTL